MNFANFAGALAAAALFASPASAAVFDLGPQVSTFCCSVRGYFFTAPTDFTITGVYVPTDASSAAQSIEVIRFNSGAPPVFSGTTNDFTSLGRWIDDASLSFISTNIAVAAGDIIGIYGYRGRVNSYGSSTYNHNIGGFDVELTRSGMQFALDSSGMHDVWQEPSSTNISRVQFSYDLGIGGVPEPGTWALMIVGFGAAGSVLRRRRIAIA